jgi:macrolide-specific efflux system membrane fusion protein
MGSIRSILRWFFAKKSRLLITILVLGALGFFLYTKTKKPAAIAPLTEQATKGTLVSAVNASGTITSGNSVSVTTNASGTVNKLYVKSGDAIRAGQTIATLTLDQTAAQLQASSYSSYLSAKNQLASAKNNLYSLQSAAFAANQKLINDAVARDLATNDPTYIQENANWLKAEADYNNQASVIKQLEAALQSAWLSYQQNSSTIVAPTSGVLTNLLIAEGLPITAINFSSNSNATAQKVATITTKTGQAYIAVNLSELDAVKVKPGQKVTVTLDALPNKTFTGKVVAIDTSGTVSSGVTTYPATIAFDSGSATIYPNMAATAKIITNVIDNAILVPSSAIQILNGQTMVRILKNGQVNSVNVEIGEKNDIQTQILSGVSEGDTVITSSNSQGTTTQGTGQTRSPFSNFGGGARGGTFTIQRF